MTPDDLPGFHTSTCGLGPNHTGSCNAARQADIDEPAPTIHFPGSWMARDPETARQVEEILGLPDHNWLDIEVRFATDEVCTVAVTRSIDREQAVALAGLLRNAS